MRMLRTGLLAGLGFLLALALAEMLARPGRETGNAGAGLDTDVSAQVWQVLAEARKITEESI